MDDAIDQMQQTAKAVMLFEVRTFEPPMREIGSSDRVATRVYRGVMGSMLACRGRGLNRAG